MNVDKQRVFDELEEEFPGFDTDFANKLYDAAEKLMMRGVTDERARWIATVDEMMDEYKIIHIDITKNRSKMKKNLNYLHCLHELLEKMEATQ